MRINLPDVLKKRERIPRYWGAHTVAQQWWCHQYFVFRAKREEGTYKKAIEHMQELGLGPGEVLKLGLEGKDYVRLRGVELKAMALPDVQARLASIGLQLGDWPADLEKMKGLRTFGPEPWLLCPLGPLGPEQIQALSEEMYLACRKDAAQYDYTVWADGTISWSSATSPASEATTVEVLMKAHPEITEAMAEGMIAQSSYAEAYLKAEAYFAWKDYLVMAVPDGLGEDFAYEFKASRVAYYALPVAKAQANLYAYFYHKPRIRVQILDNKSGKVKTYEEYVDTVAAETLLEQAEKLLKNEKQPIPPKDWKCHNCEFVAECPIAKG
jgi:CRISPR/Cas system-associated exonuclease Cas4 (RecB family)